MGSTSPSHLSRSSGKSRSRVVSRDWHFWDVREAVAWLQRSGLSQHCPAFEEESIDGAALVELTQGGVGAAELDPVLKSELGITKLGERARLRKALRALVMGSDA